MTKTHKGKVKWFNRLRGFGFIVPAEGGQDVFVHYSGIDAEGYRNLNEGDNVRYELADRGRGPMAVRVKVV